MLEEPARPVPAPPAGFPSAAVLHRKPSRKETSFRSLSRARLLPDPRESLPGGSLPLLGRAPAWRWRSLLLASGTLDPGIAASPWGSGQCSDGQRGEEGGERREGSRAADCTVRSLESNGGTDGLGRAGARVQVCRLPV